ncbi:MAG: ankyrin repeat domain-containing protein, partial [Synergistaceae bacterium]|nr:ankyrin repeat domain-containing protein [Synergistaceae bacterium]
GRKSGLDLVNMRSPINGTTPLHSAAAGYNENPEIVRLLIEAGAEINALDFYADTPLSLAIRTQKTKKLRHLDEIISILKDAGGM